MATQERPAIRIGADDAITRCPFLKHAVADWLWPVEGICRARKDGSLMAPPIPHFLHLCTTPEHRLCEVFRARTCRADQAFAG